jgi:sugar O-acyltransferase (sialic acid O-acetyltransferase NeuD family)
MKLFIYCAGGLGREIFDAAQRANGTHRRWDELCFIDDSPLLGRDFYGARLWSFEAFLKVFDGADVEVAIANGEPVIRRQLFDKLRSLVADSAVVTGNAAIGAGAIVTDHCSVASLAQVGENVAINVKSIVGHDVRLGDHCVLSSMVNVGGATSIGENSYVGMGVQIREGLSIGRDVIVGMGSIVYDDIPDGVIALGNPARPMRKNTELRVFGKSAGRRGTST